MSDVVCEIYNFEPKRCFIVDIPLIFASVYQYINWTNVIRHLVVQKVQQFGIGGGGKHSRGLTFQGQWRNEQKTFFGGRRKICTTITLTRYMPAPRNVFLSGVLTIR